jgi:hypothetical protein
MIVNPGTPAAGHFGELGRFSNGEFFLGEDGTLYQLVGLDGKMVSPGMGSLVEGTLVLGQDGKLYRLEITPRLGLRHVRLSPGRHLLPR